MAPLRKVYGLALISWCVAAVAAPARRVAAAAAPGAESPSALGSYEQEALDRALAARGLEVDPAPAGKKIGFIFVVNHEVFGEGDKGLRVFNMFHRTTREHVVSREVLLRPGDAWDPEIAEETRRRLLASLYANLVVVVPVRAVSPGMVHVLVVTRDIWSLRLNSNFEYQGNVLSLLQLQPSENNLFGLNKQLTLVFDMNLGRIAIGPSYQDNNVVGTRWQLGASARLLMSRETGEAEGSTSGLSVTYPLWSYRRTWAASASVNHTVAVSRRFSGAELCRFTGVVNECDPDPAAGVPVKYKTRSVGGGASITRQMGVSVINRFSMGYGFSATERELFESDFVASPQLRQPFIDGILPRSERVSAVSMSYDMFLPQYVKVRDIETFDFVEDFLIGPNVGASASWAMPALGSQRQFWGLSGSAGYTFELPGQGLGFFAGSASSRVQDGNFIDNSIRGDAGFVTPKVAKVVRLVAQVYAQRLIENRAVPSLALGGDSGLRGYPIGAFFGQALVRTNVEVRTVGLPVWFAHAGLVAFWDAGHAAKDFDTLVLHHDFGVGVRLVIPQLQRTVIRFDWAVANRDIVTSNGSVFRTAGLPGRFSAGFSQAF